MISHNDIYALRSAFEDYNLEIPGRIVEAEALAEAAEELVAELSAGTAPDVSTVTAKTVPAVHQAIVDWPNTAAQIDAARQIERHAQSERLAAWTVGSGALMTGLQDPFNDIAGRFTQNGDTDLAAELEQLARIRDLLAHSGGPIADLGITKVEEVTRLCIPPSKTAALNEVRALGHGRLFSTSWFNDARRAPGLTLSWNIPARQVEIWNELPSQHSPEQAADFAAEAIRRRDLGLAQRAAAGW